MHLDEDLTLLSGVDTSQVCGGRKLSSPTGLSSNI